MDRLPITSRKKNLRDFIVVRIFDYMYAFIYDVNVRILCKKKQKDAFFHGEYLKPPWWLQKERQPYRAAFFTSSLSCLFLFGN
ncbi:MAG: hypothetical protein J6C80_01415, partial [Flavobacteriales bacterium]|nr:hypothetical protein [Flavobacteriales bacterium]